jgi:hypothetical protein
MHRALGQQGQDRGPDIAAASPRAAASAPIARAAAAGELVVAMVAGMTWSVSVVHPKYLSIDT